MPRNSARWKHTQKTNSGQTQHRHEGTRAAADAKSSTQRRGAPCLVRTVNCAITKTERRKPLMGHVCQGGCGGRLHGNCGSMFDDHDTKRVCSTCVAEAGKRKAASEGAGTGPSKRPKKTKGGSEKGSGSRARPDNNAKLEIIKFVATL